MSRSIRTVLAVSWILALLIGCRTDQKEPAKPAVDSVEPVQLPAEEPEVVRQSRTVSFYFAHPDRYGLTVEKRKVFELPDRTAMLKQVVSTLERGPLGRTLPTVPATLSVSNVFITGKTIVVDFRKEPNSARIGGIEGEALFIHSVTNTVLSVYPGEYSRVRFLVDGREPETLMGHFDAQHPFSFDSSIVLR